MRQIQFPVIDVQGPQTAWVTDACRMEPHAQETWVCVGDVLFAIVRPDDEYQVKLVIAQLVRMDVIPVRRAAQAFGYHPNSIRHWAQQLQRTGMLYEQDFKRGPAGPSKITPDVFRFIQAQPPSSSNRAVADAIAEQLDVHVSAETVRYYRRQAAAEPPAPTPIGRSTFDFEGTAQVSDQGGANSTTEAALPAPRSAEVLPIAPVATETPGAEELPLAIPPTGELPAPDPSQPVAALGFLTLAPYLAGLDLPTWLTAHPWAEPHRFAPFSVLLAWVLAFLLGCRSAEATPVGPRPDWGWVIGASHYPHPDTLRDLTHAWTDGAEGGAALVAHCGPLYRAVLPETPAIVYLDGHFLPSPGSRTTAGKGYSTLRRLPLPGHHQTSAHDADGHPWWVEEGDGEVSFYATLVQVSTRVQQWYPEQHLLVAFDRGVLSKETAAALVAAGIDFVGYGKQRTVPATLEWTSTTIRRAGVNRQCEIAESRRAWGNFEAVREIWVREGTATFPVLTSDDGRAEEELLQALWGRWGQENNFELLVHDYGLNHFGDRVLTEGPDRAMANPRRARITRDLDRVEAGLGRLRRRYPDPNGRDGLGPEAPKPATIQWTQLQERRAALAAAVDAEPETVPLADLAPREHRQTFVRQRKAFQDACRVIAINGEYWLREQLGPYYPNPRHQRALARWLVRSTGWVRQEGQTLHITLVRPARPRWAKAVADFLAALNAQDPRHPTNPGYHLRFALQPARRLKRSRLPG